MKIKPSPENCSDHLKDNVVSHDSCETTDNTGIISRRVEQNKSPKEAKTWCSYMERGFSASRGDMAAEGGKETDSHDRLSKEDTSPADSWNDDNIR